MILKEDQGGDWGQEGFCKWDSAPVQTPYILIPGWIRSICTQGSFGDLVNPDGMTAEQEQS